MPFTHRLAAVSLAWAIIVAGLTMARGDEPSPPLAIRGAVVHTMAGPSITDGVVLIEGGTIKAVGPAAEVAIPSGTRMLQAAVVTPGLIDAHTVVGLTGWINQPQDQDQLDPTEPMQPELRAIDSYNPRDRLIEWVRGFGVTTLHTGHAPGALVSGQTMIVKTTGDSVEAATLRPTAMVAVTLGDDARPGGADAEKKSPGTRSKAVAMLRSELVKAGEYARRRATGGDEPPDRDLRRDVLADVLARKLPLLVTVNRATDIDAALRIAAEFNIRIVIDSGAEAYLCLDRLKATGVPVILHPSMRRAGMGETENISFETAAKLRAAGIPFALQSGFEGYVPKTRVALFEAAIAAANGLTTDQALAAITSDAAAILGIADRVGAIKPGLDGDVALFDGDPLEYTTHCTGVVINGRVVSDDRR
ncbi:MAG: amidohydrolase family protein [Pirellulales bacterium]